MKPLILIIGCIIGMFLMSKYGKEVIIYVPMKPSAETMIILDRVRQDSVMQRAILHPAKTKQALKEFEIKEEKRKLKNLK